MCVLQYVWQSELSPQQVQTALLCVCVCVAVFVAVRVAVRPLSCARGVPVCVAVNAAVSVQRTM